MNRLNEMAEAIYEESPQWGSLWAKTEEIQEEYRALARIRLAIAYFCANEDIQQGLEA